MDWRDGSSIGTAKRRGASIFFMLSKERTSTRASLFYEMTGGKRQDASLYVFSENARRIGMTGEERQDASV